MAKSHLGPRRSRQRLTHTNRGEVDMASKAALLQWQGISNRYTTHQYPLQALSWSSLTIMCTLFKSVLILVC